MAEIQHNHQKSTRTRRAYSLLHFTGAFDDRLVQRLGGSGNLSEQLSCGADPFLKIHYFTYTTSL